MRVYPRARMLWKTKIGSGWGGGQSSATTCQLFVVPRNKMRKEEKEGDRYFLDTVAMYRQLETVGALAWAFSWNAAFTVPTSSLCFLLTARHKTYCRTYFFKPFTSMTSTQMLGFGHLRFVITLDIYIYNTTTQNLNMLASVWIDIWDSGTCFTLFASNGWCCCPKVLGRIKVRLSTYCMMTLTSEGKKALLIL